MHLYLFDNTRAFRFPVKVQLVHGLGIDPKVTDLVPHFLFHRTWNVMKRFRGQTYKLIVKDGFPDFSLFLHTRKSRVLIVDRVELVAQVSLLFETSSILDCSLYFWCVWLASESKVWFWSIWRLRCWSRSSLKYDCFRLLNYQNCLKKKTKKKKWKSQKK